MVGPQFTLEKIHRLDTSNSSVDIDLIGTAKNNIQSMSNVSVCEEKREMSYHYHKTTIAYFFDCFTYTLKNAGLKITQRWVKKGRTQRLGCFDPAVGLF